MKTLKYILGIMGIAGMTACNSGIDPITPVEPGSDLTPPEVAIAYPSEGALIQVVEDVATIIIQIEVVDDIEIGNIVLQLDGNGITTFDSFKDYRRAVESYSYDKITNGKHTLEVIATDISGKTTRQSVNFEKIPPYKPLYEGEIFYMPFNGDVSELVSITSPEITGSPGFSDEGKIGKAYAGTPDSYLIFPTERLVGNEFSAACWYKLKTTPDRAGILTAGPEDTANPAAMNNRSSGFRFFREGSADKQTFKLNVGDGVNEYWFDGGDAASLAPDGEWKHLAFTITKAECKVYINGNVVSSGKVEGFSWEGCDILTIASGAPRFTGWSHLSEESLIDELRLFNKALTQQQILQLMDAK
ncbi:MAG: hypothetical protein LBS88_07815 [Tannerellaceae bacterium]|jgi:hypothetical protein|nr:hypothetical protein [Tannerellaceae bacterium]